MKIRISYEIVSDTSAENGDVEERGWVDEDGVEFETAEEALEFLENNGPMEMSSSSWDRGLWYTSHQEMDPRTGMHKSLSYHLSDFKDEDAKMIYGKIKT